MEIYKELDADIPIELYDRDVITRNELRETLGFGSKPYPFHERLSELREELQPIMTADPAVENS
jgi:hypothetical protein